MEHNGDYSEWGMQQRRVEGLVSKHMADIALDTLQQRLAAVSDEMHSLSEHVSSRRSGEVSKAEPPTGTVTRAGELHASGHSTDDKLMSSSTENAAQRKIISLLVEIKEEQQRQWVVLRDLQTRILGQASNKEEEEEEEVEAVDLNLPLRTLEQLDNMEKQLEEPATQKRMVSFLSRMGGATVDDAVRRLMQAVLSFAVGSELNWVGRGQKRSFRVTRLQAILFRALKRTPVGREATHHQYADVVKKWLRFAPFRQGGGGRRCYRAPVEFPEPDEIVSFAQGCSD
ncbi:uncharacterized protein LOC143009941 [Genypterus blacodes]|uniref:uncharacterized protein LOC143009941 n=1 Tax=Genypterus blacodes TaxID=154954 RepID=UPI003F7662A1